MNDITKSRPLTDDEVAEDQEAILVGAASAARQMLCAMTEGFGEDITLNAIAHYVLVAAQANEADPRDFWNQFVLNLRNVYFGAAELSNN